jgi:threonine aldolase
LENTLNGIIYPQDELIKIHQWAKQQNPPIIVHCDGARIWHVVAQKAQSLKYLCEPFDSVCMDLSKALGGPMGSMLCGSAAFIKHAKWIRKTFGGGLRQIGSLAACGAYALTNNFSKLLQVRELTLKLEKGLRDLGVGILVPVETNMVSVLICYDLVLESLCLKLLQSQQVFYYPDPIGLTIEQITEAAESGKYTERLWLDSGYSSRLVVHTQTSAQAIEDLLLVIRKLKEENPPPAGHPQAPIHLNPEETFHLIYNRRPGIGFS